MRNLYYLSLIILFNLNSCKEASQKQELVSDDNKQMSYQEPYRPQFHFSPPEKWMNDPNGLVYHQGKYHLFYQYYPEDIVWGPMHWGHATSSDLINWEHKPVALYPDKLGYIFSGSAVVDAGNTSGFGTKENPPLVAIFTYHDMKGEEAKRTDYQTQGIAFSLDNGDSWTKYEGNPVIGNDGSMKDFRDPKVFWYDAGKQWIMTLVAGDHAKFYKSDDLKSWELTGEFGKDKGAHGGVWECPDVFKLPVEGTNQEKWVLFISINPGAPNGGSGTQYFVGDFDGKTFTAEHDDIRWIDYGTDNYAGVTYNNLPNEDRIFIGWMSNWNYARDTPTKVWRSAMTLPRKVTLHKENGDYFIKNYPIEAFNKQLSQLENIPEIPLKETFILNKTHLNQTDIRFKFNLKDDLYINFNAGEGEELLFLIDQAAAEMYLDRRQSGIVDFEKSFGISVHKQPFKSEDKEVEIRIIIDTSSIEIFVDHGRYVFTDQIFPTKDFIGMIVSSLSQATIRNLKVSSVKSIWK